MTKASAGSEDEKVHIGVPDYSMPSPDDIARVESSEGSDDGDKDSDNVDSSTSACYDGE